jgi:hypothetical protein
MNEISTSLFMPEIHCDFKVIIRPPSLEYSIPASQFLLIKHLSPTVVRECFVDQLFEDWHLNAIKVL